MVSCGEKCQLNISDSEHIELEVLALEVIINALVLNEVCEEVAE